MQAENEKKDVKVLTNDIEVATGTRQPQEEKNILKDIVYAITSAADLEAFRDKVNAGDTFNNKTIMLTEDIDISSICAKGVWTPIGNDGNRFNGTFDGNGHKITGFTVDGTKTKIGFFGDNEGIIKDVIIDNCDIKTVANNNTYVGALVGVNRGTISRCGVTGKIYGEATTGKCFVGGIVGVNISGIINECYNKANIKLICYTNYGYCGGIIGRSENGCIQKTYNRGMVEAYRGTGGTMNTQAGGITGENTGIINYCYNAGDVKATNNLGSINGCDYGFSNYVYWENKAPNKLGGYTPSNKVGTNASVTQANLKAMSGVTLSEFFVLDTSNKNNGYPILRWE